MSDQTRTGDLQWVTFDMLAPAEDNLRRSMRDLDDLEDSIVAQGVLQPLLVTTNGTDLYKVVAGHRRTAAVGQAIEKNRIDRTSFLIPIMIREDLADADRMAAMVVENVQRQDLDPIEEAGGYQRLIELAWSQDDIAAKVGRHQSHISKRLSLLRLDERLQGLVARGTLTVEVGQLLSKLEDQEAAYGLWERHGEHMNTSPQVVENAIKGEKARLAAYRLSEAAIKAGLPVIDRLELTGSYRWNGDSYAKVAEAKAVVSEWDPEDDSRYLVVVVHGDFKPKLDVFERVGKALDEATGKSPDEASKRAARLERITNKLLTEAKVAIVARPPKTKVLDALARAFVHNEVMASTAKPIATLLDLEPLTAQRTEYGTGEIKMVKDWVATVESWAAAGDKEFFQTVCATLLVRYSHTQAVQEFLADQGVDQKAIQAAAEEQL